MSTPPFRGERMSDLEQIPQTPTAEEKPVVNIVSIAEATKKPHLTLVDRSAATLDDSISWEDIQNASDITLGKMPVPEWGRMPDNSPRYAYLKMLSAREALDMAKRVTDPSKKTDALLELVQRCLVNPKTLEPIVPPAGISVFEKRSIVVFRRLQDACLEINAMGDEKKESEAAKND
jgi:hypothetical protein